MTKNLLHIAMVGVSLGLLSGCNSIGNAPEGASPDEVKAEIAKEDPMQQIRNLNFAPIPAAQKEQQISAIEAKYHVKREDAMKNLPAPKFSMAPPPTVPTGK